jgi:hypothetical protein
MHISPKASINERNPLKIWEMYLSLVAAVKQTHDETVRDTGEPMFYCHDFDHVVRVAERAIAIAEDEDVGRLTAVAALCQNADRILQKVGGLGPFGKVPDPDIIALVEEWLDNEPAGSFCHQDRTLVVNAVLHHSERNSPNDSPILICLKDADRTVNLEADVIVRKGQYFGDQLPVVDPVHLLGDPHATFMKPGSLLRALKFDVDDFRREGGVASLRLPKARKIAASRFQFLEMFLAEVLKQRLEAGLIPYPEELM